MQDRARIENITIAQHKDDKFHVYQGDKNARFLEPYEVIALVAELVMPDRSERRLSRLLRPMKP